MVTYSVIARHPRTGELGVAVQSHFFGVGSAVNWARAGVGVVATQSFVNSDYGALGIERMAAGQAPAGVLADLLAADPRPDLRQVAMLDAAGAVAVHTGDSCVHSRGSRSGDGYSVQGNMLATDQVLGAAEAALVGAIAAGEELAPALVSALTAAEQAGGDARGSQAAGIVVVGGEPTDQPWREVRMDLRVEDAQDPIGELTRLVDLHTVTADLVEVMFAEGLMLGPFREPEPGAVDRALERLDRVARRFGPGNLEPHIWRTVLLARAGRTEQAAQDLAEIGRRRPQLRTFIKQVAAAGFVPEGAEWADQ